jgi:type IV pilus assembly protein PilF
MTQKALYVCVLIAMLLSGCAGNATLESEPDKLAIAAQANTRLGVEYLREGEYELSLKKLSKAIDMKPDYAPAHEAIAVLYDRVGKNELAEKHYRRALKLAPGNADAHNNYGQFLCRTGRHEEAEKEFQIAINNPFYKTKQFPLLNAGMCMMSLPDLEKAEQFFRKAIASDSEFGPALLQMALLYYNSQDYLRARAYLQRFQAAEQHTPESLWLGVRIEYALNDHETWGNYALQLRNLHPDSEQAALLQGWENERRAGN